VLLGLTTEGCSLCTTTVQLQVYVSMNLVALHGLTLAWRRLALADCNSSLCIAVDPLTAAR
jgi:hypothetical protein